MTVSELHTRAMLVTLNIRAWSARKYDKKVSQDTVNAHGASSDAGRFNKCLLPGDTSTYKALMAHLAASRVRHYDLTLPWADDGWRCLPVRAYQRYTDQLRADKHTAETLIEEFSNDYPSLREAARIPLNGMWKEEDYPKNIRSKFGFSFDFAPVPAADDFRVHLSQDEINMIAVRTEERVKKAFEDAQSEATKRLFDVVAKMQAKLAEPDAIFRDSLIGNVRDLCEVLTSLNLTEDPALEALRRQTELLAMTEPETLRKDSAVRIDTANRAQSILDAMQATYGSNLFGGK